MQSNHTTEPAGVPARTVLTLKSRPTPQDFWINWRVGGPRPKRKHASLHDALTERSRLSQLQPGERFDTYQCSFVSSQQVRS